MTSTRPLQLSRRSQSSGLRLVIHEGGTDDLARRAAQGDEYAFSALMTAHKADLYRFVRRRVADADEAYDVVQDSFVAAWRAIARFDPDRPFGAWLRAIALNKCRDRARRAGVRAGLWNALDPRNAARARAATPSPEEEVVARDELSRLAQAIEALPQRFRDALMLTTVDGMSQASASAVLGCSVKAVEYRALRARRLLARELGWDSSQ